MDVLSNERMKPMMVVAVVTSCLLIFDGQVYNGRFTRGASSMLTQIAYAVGLR
jgi:hypothetical protein